MADASIMKPQDYINSLIQSVSDFASIKYCNVRTKVNVDSSAAEPMTFILHNGSAELYRAKDHLLMKNIQAPAIFGINFVFDDVSKIYLAVSADSRYEVLPRSRLEKSVRENNLWETHAYLQMYNVHRLTEAHFSLIGSSAYEALCSSLVELMNEPSLIREAMAASEYIQRKTGLSRSGVMKMLSDLKAGGYIKLARGKLTNIVHLPKTY